MGTTPSTPKPTIRTISTAAPVTSSTPYSFKPKKEHLILAFFAGVLLTLLLVILTLLIKSCRKCNSSAQTRYPHSEPPTKLSSISKESLTYASMTFKSSEENSNDLTRNHSSGLDPTVYSQIKVTDP
ncbi:transmembrane protein C1orf162 homolog [Rattus norvegicus]|nr:transmembrane protein C1orf162 homolog isoform X2 [Rattus norvegicus]XP_038959749.1 transmembrane protein C1orf162 homolog isoform X2 [Rattus norvegicus]XP_038959750.1 transmembrane protein C1orf162 homolog isoform X2 [Rattus norvegicus]|eukprot:XP_006233166.1 PREDICTED: transmembrane protein C1orf162 homolog [Rattus norvegicus]